MKKYIILAVLIAAIAIPAQALADRMRSETSAGASGTGQAVQARMDNLKDRANREIDRRVDALGKMVDKISGMKRLTADEKSSFTSQINQNIDDLNNLN